jgi:hypothetical protein
MIPTMILLGLDLAERGILAGALLLAGAGFLAVANAGIGVLLHQAALRMYRRFRHRTPSALAG